MYPPQETREARIATAELSGRESQILGLAAAGFLDKNIATELGISIHTVGAYWARIRLKRGRLPRTALVAAYVTESLVAHQVPQGVPISSVQLISEADPNVLRQAAIYYATALQRVQATLRKADRAAQVLAAYPRLAFSVETEAEFVRSVCRLVVEEGGYLMAWVGIAQNDEAKSIRVAGSFGDSDGYLDDVAISWGDNSLGTGPGGTAIRTGQTQVNQDFFANPKVALWRDEALKRGFQSSIGLPLKSDSRVFGFLSAYANEPEAFDRSEVGLLELLAADVGVRLAAYGTTAPP